MNVRAWMTGLCKGWLVAPKPGRGVFVRALALALIVVSSNIPADRVLLIGDSWGWRRLGSMRQVIIFDNGHEDVEVSAPPRILFSHRLAAADGLQSLTEWLGLYPDTTVVHLSMGANDLSITPEQIGTAHESAVHSRIIRDVDIAVDHIWAIRPDVEIMWSGYDFFRPKFFGPKPAESNEIHMRFGQACAEYAAAKDPRITYSDIYGELQLAFGFDGIQTSPFDPPFPIPPGDPSLPDPQWPSPREAYPEFDFDHPNEAGWKALAEAQYTSYYQSRFKGAGFQINPGLNDAWFNAATAGQGFFIIVFEDTGIGFLAWFTYDTALPPDDIEAFLGAPGHRWLTAQGPFDGDTATLDVFLTEGGVFDMAAPAPVTGESIGAITIVWTDCENGVLTYDIDPPGSMGEIPITRIVPDNVALCEAWPKE